MMGGCAVMEETTPRLLTKTPKPMKLRSGLQVCVGFVSELTGYKAEDIHAEEGAREQCNQTYIY